MASSSISSSRATERRHRALMVFPARHTAPGECWVVRLHDGQLVKGQDLTVRALEQLKDAKVSVVFVGSGDRINEVKSLVTSLGLGDRFVFTGQVTNAIDYVYAADAVLMPSRSEGLSIACLEAVCAGKPVIVSDILAFAPFRRSSTVLFDSGSPDSLAAGIRRALTEKDLLAAQALEERERYRREFDIKAVATHYIDSYRELERAEDTRASPGPGPAARRSQQ